MNLIRRIKFSLSAIKAFIVFLIKAWKSAVKSEKDMNELVKWLKSIKKYQKKRIDIPKAKKSLSRVMKELKKNKEIK